MNWYLKVIRNYAVFTGRARRKEFWMFMLFNMIFILIVEIIGTIIFMVLTSVGVDILYSYMVNMIIIPIYLLAIFIPSLAVSVRRLHDLGKSGWYMLLPLIPIVGFFWLMVLFCFDSEPLENEYGNNPKDDSYIKE